MKKYNINTEISANEIKDFRAKLDMTQKEFAEFLGISKPTIERWERSKQPITGPVAMLIHVLSENSKWMEEQEIPEKTYPLRLKYMFKKKCCTIIDVDEVNQQVKIRNYVKNRMFLAFGVNENPSYEDYKVFLKSRCFPETRDKIKIQLEALDIPFYDPLLIIEKTEGRMAEDDFWIMIER